MLQKTKNPLTNILAVCVLALICCALWASAFPCIKIGYRLFKIDSSMPQNVILFAGMRFVLSGLLVILFASVSRKRFLKIKTESFGRVAVLSLFQTILQYLFFYIGLSNTTGVKASIISGSNVFLVIIVTSLIFREEKYTLHKFIGSVIGLAGVIIVNMSGNGIDSSLSLFGDGFVLLSSVAYAFSSAFLKKFAENDDTIMLSAYQFIFGGFILIAVGLISGGRITYFSPKAFLLLIYLAFISAAAYSIWSALLANNDVSRVAIYGFSTPVFGVLFSKFLLPNENGALGLNIILALILVCVGIFIINSKKIDYGSLSVKHV
ncbi:MAG: DMT family transporter [Candidatus Metalachnospira sp.]|nr:DMT family transporter [Candidatus Metalachnospira sp.]